MMLDIDTVAFGPEGLVPVVTQDARTGRVLMMAWANRRALELSLETGDMHYFSRKRGLWRKGETSGNTQRLHDLRVDCDGDTLLARVEQTGWACHTGTGTCFGDDVASDALDALDRLISERVAGDAGYTGRLLADRNLRVKKLGEEVAELVLACADGERQQAVAEAADLVYHTMVALRAVGGSWAQVRAVLVERAERDTAIQQLDSARVDVDGRGA